MSFSPLLSKRISQTQISQILLFVKAPSFFSSTRWYIFILVPWVLYLKKVSRGFLEISSSTPNPLLGSFQTRCSHWKTSSLAQLLTVQRCSELLQIHFLTVTRFVLIHSTGLPLVQWSFIKWQLDVSRLPSNWHMLSQSITKRWCWKLHLSDL